MKIKWSRLTKEYTDNAESCLKELEGELRDQLLVAYEKEYNCGRISFPWLIRVNFLRKRSMLPILYETREQLKHAMDTVDAVKESLETMDLFFEEGEEGFTVKKSPKTGSLLFRKVTIGINPNGMTKSGVEKEISLNQSIYRQAVKKDEINFSVIDDIFLEALVKLCSYLVVILATSGQHSYNTRTRFL